MNWGACLSAAAILDCSNCAVELLAHTPFQIAGPPGCGKTQFSLMLSIVAVLSPSLGGLGRQVVYIDTEAAFTAER